MISLLGLTQIIYTYINNTSYNQLLLFHFLEYNNIFLCYGLHEVVN